MPTAELFLHYYESNYEEHLTRKELLKEIRKSLERTSQPKDVKDLELQEQAEIERILKQDAQRTEQKKKQPPKVRRAGSVGIVPRVPMIDASKFDSLGNPIKKP